MAKVTKNKKQEFEDIVICQYAGDPDDEYCSECNGKTMEIDGQVFSCKECQSYTPQEEVKEESPTVTDETPRDDTNNTEADIYTPVGITTSIKAESGVSIETKKGWYRFAFSEERIVPETANIEEEKEALWNSVNAEVDRQIEEVKLMCNEK